MKRRGLTQAFRGHGFSDPIWDQSAGRAVPGTWGPQIALSTAAGMGGSPELTQMMASLGRLPQPFQPQLLLLNVSISSTEIWNLAAMREQYSPGCTVYVAHVPSGFGLGLRSGSEPSEQHTSCPGWSVLQKVEPGLYLYKSAVDMPHLDARAPHKSPGWTVTVEHSAPILSSCWLNGELAGGETQHGRCQDRGQRLPFYAIPQPISSTL